MNRPIPFDIYNHHSGRLEHCLKAGLSFSEEVSELFRARDIESVRAPKGQKALYDRYRLEIEKELEARRSAGFIDTCLDPRKALQHLIFMDEYHPICAESLVPGDRASFEVYIRIKGEIMLAHGRGEALDDEKRGMWAARDMNILIKKSDRGAYLQYLMDHARNSMDERTRAVYVREESKLIVESLAENPRSGKLVARAKKSVGGLTNMVIDNPATFYSLIKINNYDYYTFTHSVNVATLCLAVAVNTGMDDERDLGDLGLGAIIHDLGKARVDPALINKPGKLTDIEYKLVTNHVELGHEMIRENTAIPKRAHIPLLQHHEKLSGKGYPFGLAGKDVHTFGRIAAIMDIYDALTTERVYRKAFKPYDALALLFKGGDDYDKSLLSLLTQTLGEQSV